MDKLANHRSLHRFLLTDSAARVHNASDGAFGAAPASAAAEYRVEIGALRSFLTRALKRGAPPVQARPRLG